LQKNIDSTTITNKKVSLIKQSKFMSKIKLFVIASLVVLISNTATAQKSGYISIDQVIQIMPELGRIDTLLQKFQRDSINAEFTSLVQEYNYKDSMLNSRDSAKTPATVRRQMRQDLEAIAYQVQNWQAIAQNAFQAKQEELLAPLYRKAITTLNTVAKENGYSYVYSKEALLVAPPGDDLLPLVAKKLNIKLPPTTNTPAGATPKK
jgi:outer membrane protein